MTDLAARDRIIVPLDVSDVEAAITLIDRLPEAQFFKVGLELFVATGSTVLTILKERQKKIFLDLKLHDIPNTMAGACRSAARYGVDLLTIHATAGKPALEAAQAGAIAGAAAAGVQPPTLLAVTVLTSLSQQQLTEELHVPEAVPNYVQHLARQAEACGIGGCVCSPQELVVLKTACSDDFVRVTPGVRPTWAAAGDQQRVMTPQQAIAAGATYLVVGRPITAADDPAAAFQRVCEELTP
ncbi:orotidine-5'-phosphate decarboxylase [Synechococcus elongatus]|uniref:orotidine-5'-phosphate decarboxylase n=1 Tax=Synechococcus elongatus TaxID=32046 RepID=UPI000F7F6EC6|nr:orotidine-5'-phosphate decarboxylase [Synechococcus elongatus]